MAASKCEGNWTHAQCGMCWFMMRDTEPVVVRGSGAHECCWCGGETHMGIFVREDPRVLHPEMFLDPEITKRAEEEGWPL